MNRSTIEFEMILEQRNKRLTRSSFFYQKRTRVQIITLYTCVQIYVCLLNEVLRHLLRIVEILCIQMFTFTAFLFLDLFIWFCIFGKCLFLWCILNRWFIGNVWDFIWEKMLWNGKSFFFLFSGLMQKATLIYGHWYRDMYVKLVL